MKKLYSFILAALISATLFSQAPEKMSYQAVIRNGGNELVKTTQVGMQISILQGSETGTPVYVETQTPTTNANGLATIEIGAGTIVSGTFAGINWSAGTYFIKTETDPLGGATYTITGTSQLLSVPYALYSKTVEKLSIPSQASGDLMYFNGTSWLRLPRGTTGQVMTINNLGEYVWVNQFSISTAVTSAASDITGTGATLNGSVNAKDFITAVSFEYGLTTGYGSSSNATESPVTGSSERLVSVGLTGLTSGTTYHYRTKSVNPLGTVYGNDLTFKTLSSPYPENGLVAYYPFNGNANDVSSNNLNGTVTGASLTSDRFNNVNCAYLFNLVGQHIDFFNSDTWGSGSHTISFWFNSAYTPGKQQNLLTKRSSCMGGSEAPWFEAVIHDNANSMHIGWAGGGFGSSYLFNFTPNQWNMVTYVVDGTTSSLYLNGVLLESLPHTSTTNSIMLRAGNHSCPVPDDDYFGKFDDLGIWNRVLTGSEIQNMYSYGF